MISSGMYENETMQDPSAENEGTHTSTRSKWQSEDLKSLNDDTLSAGKLLLVGIDPSDKEQQYHYPRVRLFETLGTVGEWYSPQEY